MRNFLVIAALMASGCAEVADNNATDAAAEGETQATSQPFIIPKAAPALADTTIVTRIAFGSCADEEKPQPLWQTILKDKPQLFLFTGDNVYADINEDKWVNDPSLPALDFSYGKLGTHPDFTEFYRQVPMMITWDDHDYGKNDAGAEFPIKAAAKQKMLDFFSVSASAPERHREGVYNARIIGPEGKRVQIIMLDTRWFRSPLTPTDEKNAPGKERYLPSKDPDQAMLGEAQWAWLAAELAKPADVRLLVSSIQVLADAHGWEAWRTMPVERDRLLKLIDDKEAENLFILSGDRHVGGIYRLAEEGEHPFYEITASSINLSFNPSKAVTREWGKRQIGQLYGPENYGMIEIDWDAGILGMNIRDMDGVSVRRVTIPIQ